MYQHRQGIYIMYVHFTKKKSIRLFSDTIIIIYLPERLLAHDDTYDSPQQINNYYCCRHYIDVKPAAGARDRVPPYRHRQRTALYSIYRPCTALVVNNLPKPKRTKYIHSKSLIHQFASIIHSSINSSIHSFILAP